MNCNEEFVVKAIGKLSLEFNFNWEEQRKIRTMLYNSLVGYEVNSISQALVTSDIEEKIQFFIQVKKLEGYSMKTLKNYYMILIKFSNYIRKPVATVTKNDIRLFLSEYTAKLKPSSSNTVTYIIKGFFSWLEAEELIPFNPTKKLPVNKLPKRLRKALTVVELERLRKASKTDRDRAIIEFLFATGCRLSELVGCNVGDLNLNENTLRVVGKGDKERVVCFSDKTKFYLDNYLKNRPGNDIALFTSIRSPYQRLGNRSIEKIVSTIASRAEFDKAVFPHLLRHTMATLGLQSGADITTIQHLLGHTSVGTTQTYANESIENIKHQYKQHFIQ